MARTLQPASTRTVVLLRATERKRLEKIAAAEQVSSGEILRRALHTYDHEVSRPEEKAVGALLKEMNTALDEALVSIRSARTEIRRNLQKIAELQEARP